MTPDPSPRRASRESPLASGARRVLDGVARRLFGRTPEPTLPTLRDISTVSSEINSPGWNGIGALPIAGLAYPCPPRALLQGTALFADGDILAYHAAAAAAVEDAFDVGCFFLPDAVVTAEGRIWLDGTLLAGREFMPAYVRDLFRIKEGGTVEVQKVRELPVRVVDEPTAVLVGHGLTVYGHFLIEMLFRLLVVRRAMGDQWAGVRFLLDYSAPPWLVRLLTEDLGVPLSGLEFFDGKTERVLLRRAIVAGNAGGSHEGFHPVCNDLIDDLVAWLALPPPPPSVHERVFMARYGFGNRASAHRVCLNEAALAERARQRHGFFPVAMEKLNWREQIALVRGAKAIAGPLGSALHASLLSGAGTRVASIGCLNRVQSNIAALRGQGVGYLTRGIPQHGAFDVDTELFDAFLDNVCHGDPTLEGNHP